MENQLVLGRTPTICKLCGEEVHDLKEHILGAHQCSTWIYRKIQGLGNIPSPCFPTLRYTENLLGDIENLQGMIKGNKYLQATLSNPKAIERSVGYNAIEASEVLRTSDTEPRDDRTDYLGFKITPGFPKELSERNSEAISVIHIRISVSNDLIIKFPTGLILKINLPETCGYDSRHHHRYSIINSGKKDKGSRYTKRIRLGGNTCYKFWNNKEFPEIKSILRITDLDENPVNSKDLGAIERFLLMQIIMRTDTVSEVVWGIYNEVLRHSREVIDHVLLKNTVRLQGKVTSKFTWFPEGDVINGVNISIL